MMLTFSAYSQKKEKSFSNKNVLNEYTQGYFSQVFGFVSVAARASERTFSRDFDRERGIVARKNPTPSS